MKILILKVILPSWASGTLACWAISPTPQGIDNVLGIIASGIVSLVTALILNRQNLRLKKKEKENETKADS